MLPGWCPGGNPPSGRSKQDMLNKIRKEACGQRKTKKAASGKDDDDDEDEDEGDENHNNSHLTSYPSNSCSILCKITQEKTALSMSLFLCHVMAFFKN